MVVVVRIDAAGAGEGRDAAKDGVDVGGGEGFEIAWAGGEAAAADAPFGDEGGGGEMRGKAPKHAAREFDGALILQRRALHVKAEIAVDNAFVVFAKGREFDGVFVLLQLGGGVGVLAFPDWGEDPGG